MKLQLEGQCARIRVGEAELDHLLAGETLAEYVETPLGTWSWQIVLGVKTGLARQALGEWQLTIPDAEFRVFSAERPRRDGFVLDLAAPGGTLLQVSLEVDVRDSRRRQVAAANSN